MEELKNSTIGSQTAKVSQTQDEINKLSQSIVTLEALVENFVSNLNQILRQPDPPAPEEKWEETQIVSLAHEIRLSRRRVLSVCELIKDTIDRLEV
jgi:hypothetical protein